MVEVTLQCVEGHPFTLTFPEPIDWPRVNAAVHEKEPRCNDHPAMFSMDWYDE